MEKGERMTDEPEPAEPLPHSIARHPLRELLTAEEWEQLKSDVQYCRVSWPISWKVEPE